MKRVLVCTLLLLVAATSFSQQIDSVQPSTSEMYLSESKHQKTAGWVMLGGGAAMVTIGWVIFSNELTFDFRNGLSGGEGAAVLSLVGFVSMLGSIPLFIASGRNARKAASISFHNQEILFRPQTTFRLKRQPTLTLKIPI